MTETSVSVDTIEVSGDVDEYKYFIGTIHLDPDDGEYYMVVDVVEKTYDELEGPLIVAYKRHVWQLASICRSLLRTTTLPI